MSDRPFCAETSEENAEPLGATASRVEHWLLIEYRGLWSRRPLDDSLLPDPVKARVREQLRALPRARLLFIRRPERRGHEELLCYFGRSRPGEQRFFRIRAKSHEDLRGLDLSASLAGEGSAEPLDHPLFLVCTHGKRDRCCARYGRPLYEELRDQLADEWVWQSTHVGGDRFAGNLVCLPEGLYFGRVGRGEVGPLLDEYRGGRIYLERFRGRCSYDFPVQAAERAVRERTGLTGIHDLRLISAERDAVSWRVRFARNGTEEVQEAEVRAELGDLAYLTCGAASLERPRRFVARV